MKKTLSVILIALIAMTGLFAVNAREDNTIGDSVDTTVTLSISEDQVSRQLVGFTAASSGSLPSTAPEALKSIDLTYSRDDVVEAENYIYYYFETSAKPSMTLTPGAGLGDSSYGNDKISYTLTVGGRTADSGTLETIDLPIGDLSAGVTTSFIKFKVSLANKAEIKPDMVGYSWSDTITVSIVAG